MDAMAPATFCTHARSFSDALCARLPQRVITIPIVSHEKFKRSSFQLYYSSRKLRSREINHNRVDGKQNQISCKFVRCLLFGSSENQVKTRFQGFFLIRVHSLSSPPLASFFFLVALLFFTHPSTFLPKLTCDKLNSGPKRKVGATDPRTRHRTNMENRNQDAERERLVEADERKGRKEGRVIL